MSQYHCLSSQSGIAYNYPLWKLKSQRTEEWNEIVLRLSSSNKSQFLKILEDDDVQGLLAVSKTFTIDTKDKCAVVNLLNFFADRSDKSYGWLTKKCVQYIGIRSALVNFLSDIHNSYTPIFLVKDIEEDNIELKLGASAIISVEAKGVPSVHYQWLYLPFVDESMTSQWRHLDLNPLSKRLYIDNFQKSDSGTYKCRVYHNIPVKLDDGSLASDIFSKSVYISVELGSINVISHPMDTKGFFCGQVQFSTSAESTHSLTYQWYHNDTKIVRDNGEEGCLNISDLRFEHSGTYHCVVYNEITSLKTRTAELVVEIPSLDVIRRQELRFDNENIRILKQPKLSSLITRASIGEKLYLDIVSTCKYPLHYEWCKRGLYQDLIDKDEPERLTELIPVCRGPQLTDEIMESSSVSRVGTWIYFCLITCPQTNEKVVSDSVRVPVSTRSAQSCSFPQFKIALIICQEDYKSYEDLHELQAPKYDGSALIKALKEMDFEILSFINLTLEELRNVIELLCTFIDEATYVLVYYNGHALGVGTDIYLTGIDSTFASEKSLYAQFIWHGELEARIDSFKPLLCVFMYDSCRDDPPESIAEILRNVKHKALSFNSSFVISYGTQPSMKSYECYEKTIGACQGLYMKYLLQHISENIRVEEIFVKLSDSFTLGEDTSVVKKMRPELKVSTKQAFYLTSPLRSNKFGQKQIIFFRMCRFPSSIPTSSTFIESEFKYVLGLAVNQNQPCWITGSSDPKVQASLKYLLRVIVKESNFLNEALLELNYESVNHTIPFSLKGFEIQLSSPNVDILSTSADSSSHAPIDILYDPCMKKNVGRQDGPIFPFVVDMKSGLIGKCKLINLQRVDGNVKIRLNIRKEDDSLIVFCKGILEFSLPIVQNFPLLKINNNSLKYL